MKYNNISKEISEIKLQLGEIVSHNNKLQKHLNQLRVKNSNQSNQKSVDSYGGKNKSKRECSCSLTKDKKTPKKE